jgi:hypothetical protein
MPNQDIGRPSLDPSLRIVPRALRVEPAVRCPDKLYPACRLTSASSDRTTEEQRGIEAPPRDPHERGADRRVVSLANLNELFTALFEPSHPAKPSEIIERRAMTSDFDDCASTTNGDGDDRARARNPLRCFRPAAGAKHGTHTAHELVRGHRQDRHAMGGRGRLLRANKEMKRGEQE